MTHQQLWWSVLGVLWRLLVSNLAEIPDVETTVGTARGQNGFVVRRPLNLLVTGEGGRRRRRRREKLVKVPELDPGHTPGKSRLCVIRMSAASSSDS